MTDTTPHRIDSQPNKRVRLVVFVVLSSALALILLSILLPVALVPFGALLVGVAYYINRYPYDGVNPGVLFLLGFGVVAIMSGLSVLV